MSPNGEIWGEFLQRFNLISFIRTFPIGVPSLLAAQSPLETPLGPAPVFEVKSMLAAFGLLVAILSVGFSLGCLYFNLLARSTAEGAAAFELKAFANQVLQTFFMTMGLIFLLTVLSIPVMLALSIVAFISPNLADIALILSLIHI